MTLIYPGSVDKTPRFLAHATLFALSPETRTSPAKNGIRWNITCQRNLDNPTPHGALQHMCWPVFTDENHQPIDEFLETEIEYHIYLYPLSSESVADWMKLGAEFFLMEGGRKVGVGEFMQDFEDDR